MTAGLFSKKKSNNESDLELEASASNLIRTAPIIIPEDTLIEGCFSSKNSIRIEGHLNGVLYSKQVVTIDDRALINGNIVAAEVIVSGKINGNIYCLGKVLIKNGGEVDGNVYSPRFQNDEGSNLTSNISIINNSVSQELIVYNEDITIGANLAETEAYKTLINIFETGKVKNSRVPRKTENEQ